MKPFVGNLKFDTSEPELYEHLKSCVVGEVRIFVDRNGLPSIGFVTMKREQDDRGGREVEGHGAVLDGRALTVALAPWQ